MKSDDEKFGILDDGFYRCRPDEEAAEPEKSEAVLLGDALAISGEIAAPRVFSESVQRVLDMPPDADAGAAGRSERLEKMARLVTENSASQDDDVPMSDSSQEEEEKE